MQEDGAGEGARDPERHGLAAAQERDDERLGLVAQAEPFGMGVLHGADGKWFRAEDAGDVVHGEVPAAAGVDVAEGGGGGGGVAHGGLEEEGGGRGGGFDEVEGVEEAGVEGFQAGEGQGAWSQTGWCGRGEEYLAGLEVVDVDGVLRGGVHGFAAVGLRADDDDGLVGALEHGQIDGAVAEGPDVGFVEGLQTLEQGAFDDRGDDELVCETAAADHLDLAGKSRPA